MSIRTPPRPASSITVLVFDWLIYAATMLSYFDAFWTATLAGGLLTFAFVYTFESNSSTAESAFLRSLFAAAAVSMPLPLLGTALGVIGTLWELSARRKVTRERGTR